MIAAPPPSAGTDEMNIWADEFVPKRDPSPPRPVGYKGTGPNYNGIAKLILGNAKCERGGDELVHRLIQDAVKAGALLEMVSPYHIKDGKGYFSVQITLNTYNRCVAHLYGTFDGTLYICDAIDYFHFSKTYSVAIKERSPSPK